MAILASWRFKIIFGLGLVLDVSQRDLIVAVLLMRVIDILQAFGLIWALPVSSAFQWGMGPVFASGVPIALPVAFAVLLLQRYSVPGHTLGAFM